MKKNFHKILGVSILPALLVMPALAYDVEEDINLNTVFEDGVIQDFLRSESGFVGTLTTPSITITGASQVTKDSTKTDPEWGTQYLVRTDGEGSVLNLGTSENVVDSIDIKHTGYDARAVTVWDNSQMNIYGKRINIDGDYYGITVWPTLGKSTALLNVEGDDINIVSAKGRGILSEEGANVVVDGKTIVVSGGYNGIEADNSGQINVTADDLTAHGDDTAIMANYKKGQITIDVTGDVNASAKESAIHAGFGTADIAKAKADTSFVDITAKNINLTADETAISAMSNGWIDLNGNLTVKAKNAILARGYSTVNVNASGKNTVKMDGDVNFNFYSNPGSGGNSNSPIDAYANVNLSDDASYWTGNTLVEYYYKDVPAEGVLDVHHFNLALSNGATWNATKIADTSKTVIDEETENECTEGQYYIALNNLDIAEGTVNIMDTTRGITVENAIVADATFNGGPLNVGSMAVSGGENTFNTNVNADTLVLADGAIMNIGTNSIVADTMLLNGTLNATLLNTNKFASLEVGEFAEDAGSMNLTLKGVGDYKVFKGETFDDVVLVYDDTLFAAPVWNEAKDTITVSMRAAEDIAKDTGVDAGAVATVSHIAEAASNSDSVQLQTLSLKLQEKLASGDAAAVAAVEHATKAIHPETESVSRSVSSSVQNTVVNVASARMALPAVGRNGGDVNLTSGGVWAQGLFNKSKQNDSFRGYTRGIAAGIDGTINKVWTIGAGYSFAHSDISGSARDTEIDSNTVFVYGQYKPSAWYINAVANYTMSDYSEKGTVIDDELVFADYDVDSFGGTVATGYDFANGITPELGLRYMHVNTSDYTNTYGIKTSMKDTDFLTGILGAKYAFNVVANKHLTFAPQLNAGVKYDFLSDKSASTVAMPGVDAYTLNGTRLNRFGGEFGIGLGMQYDALQVSLNYDIDVRKDYTSQTGMLKFRYNF